VAAAVIAASAYRASPAASWSWLAAGGLLAFVASIVDGCDGEIARLKFLQSDRGAWLDAVLDRYADALLLFALLWRVYRAGDPLLSGWMAADAIPSLAVVTGVLAIVGAFMLSYTADKYDALMADAFARGTRFRLGRDVRILIVVVGVMLNLCFLVLLVHAVWMNAEVARRVWICGVARA
jgi:CDP-L-myo-inositol myo-inositolphosphotransferase